MAPAPGNTAAGGIFSWALAALEGTRDVSALLCGGCWWAVGTWGPQTVLTNRINLWSQTELYVVIKFYNFFPWAVVGGLLFAGATFWRRERCDLEQFPLVTVTTVLHTLSQCRIALSRGHCYTRRQRTAGRCQRNQLFCKVPAGRTALHATLSRFENLPLAFRRGFIRLQGWGGACYGADSS